MEIEEVSKELAILKPVDQRILGLQSLFSPLFQWQQNSLLGVQKFANECDEFLNETDFKGIKGVELKLNEARKLKTSTNKERTDLTGSFDKIKKRCMIAEEAYENISKKLETKFIELKKAQQSEIDKVQRRQNELNIFKARIQEEFNRLNGAQLLYIQSKVTESYADALDLIEPEDILDFLDELKRTHSPEQFGYLDPRSALDKVDTEKNAIYIEIFKNWDSARLSSEFSSLLDSTFSDFDTAKKNKEAAMSARQVEQRVEAAAIVEEVETLNVLAEIEQKSAPEAVEMFESTRSLKDAYIIDMEHTYENMMVIEKAFYANRQQCIAAYRGKDIWEINAIKKGELLCILKKGDSSFQPDGVIFAKIDKI